jgi:hypothetical protein
VVLDAVEVPPSLNVDVVTYAAVLELGEFVTEPNNASARGCLT